MRFISSRLGVSVFYKNLTSVKPRRRRRYNRLVNMNVSLGRRVAGWVLSLTLAAAACGGGGQSAGQMADGSKPAQVITIDGSSTVFPVTEAVAEEFQKESRGIDRKSTRLNSSH